MTNELTAATGSRRLALFLDGTWDRAIGNTNVWRLKSLCAPGANQLVYYSAGVGTANGETARGGIFGYGIDDVLNLAYQIECETTSSAASSSRLVSPKQISCASTHGIRRSRVCASGERKSLSANLFESGRARDCSRDGG